MLEKRPLIGGELEPVKVDVKTLGRRIQSSLASLVEGELSNIVVDVESRPTLSHAPEWRINVPAKMGRLYLATSELVSQADAFYREFVSLGAMEPRKFTVSVWCLSNNEEAIKGSFD